MKNIIEKLYLGELCPAKEVASVLKEYEQLFEKKKYLEKDFYANLSQEERNEYDKVLEEYFMLNQKELSRAFYQGFQTAVRLIFQALE